MAYESESDGGTTVHVGDCRIWAEIFYLDSPTDYREYLPSKLVQAGLGKDRLILTERFTNPSQARLPITAAATLLLLVLLLVLYCSDYL